MKAFPNQLSGGEQQRVGLARAIVNDPPLLIADEPTGNLDPARSLELLMLLQKINELGTTVLVVTHEKPLVDKLSRRVIAIDGGRIISDGMDGYYDYEAE
jgi:cell division transport system ATP-binding protein